MPCPFPGMDPYLEGSGLWPDFHDSLIAYIRESLQPHLPAAYGAVVQSRLYLVNHQRVVYPDISLLQPTHPRHHTGGGTAVAEPIVLEADEPEVIEFEEIRQPYIEIVSVRGGRVVTVIEVLSPDNKHPGQGYDSYHLKRDALLAAKTHFIEIDLLRGGLRARYDEYDRPTPSAYLTTVTRGSRVELYPTHLRSRLPRIRVPLAAPDPDVVLDLQGAFERAWSTGPYPEFLSYGEGSPKDLSAEDAEWCRQVVSSAALDRPR